MKVQHFQFLWLCLFLFHFISFTAFPQPYSAENGQAEFGWYPISFPYDENICQAVIFDSANGWVSTNCGKSLFRLTNGKWYSVPTPAQYRNLKLFGFSHDNIWTACFDKITYRHLLRHFDGQQWHDIHTHSADPIRTLEYLAPNNIWAAGVWGELIHFDGVKWQLVPSPWFGHINWIRMQNDSTGWAGGEYRGKGVLMRWNGTGWKIIKDQINGEISEIIMVNDSTGWIFSDYHNQSLIRIENYQLLYTNLPSVVKDTIFTDQQFSFNQLLSNPNGITIKNGTIHYVAYEDNNREIFSVFGEKDSFQVYLMTSDGSINYLKGRTQNLTNSSFKFVKGEQDFQNEYGVAFGDIDNDNDDDIYVINTSEGNRLKLYGGNSRIKSPYHYQFIDAAYRLNLLATIRAEDANFVYDMGVTLVDMDNDGDRDVYITSLYDKNMLYEQKRFLKFREIAKKAGVDAGQSRSNVGIWGDVDNDGDVDLFVTNEDKTNMLFFNNGVGRFQNLTSAAKLKSQRGGKGATFGDIDLDGDLDLVVPNFGIPNRIYCNEGIHRGTGIVYFKDVTDACLPQYVDTLTKSTSACLTDFDNDGDLDLYITNLVSTNRLYENDGTGYFTDITIAAGLSDSCSSNSACFFDADNDGDLDLFLANRGRNLFFKNIGRKKFLNDNDIFQINREEHSTGIACGDPDNDGDIDCYLANDDKSSFYYKNQINNHNFLKIKLIGTKSNRDAIGAKAFLFEAGHLGEKQYLLGLREINGGYGYGCMNSTVIHYGVLPGKKYDLKICFPSGIELVRNNLESGQIIIVTEQAGLAKAVSKSKRFIMRIYKSTSYQVQLAKFAGLLIALIIGLLIIQFKNWVELRFQILLFFFPVLSYLFLDVPLSGQNFWISHFLPFAVSFFIFGLIIFLSKYRELKITRERLAEELLSACRVFDHGNWATSCLNHLQLYSTNLSADQPITKKSGSQLGETITGFYELVYKQIDNIHHLAQDASIQVNQASELERQLLFLSENLDIIKVAMALNQGVPADILKNVHRLIDQIKMNIREIKFGVSRFFSCDFLEVVNKTTRNFQLYETIPILFPQANLVDDDFMVSIKASELATILEILFQNAKQATMKQHDPQIRLSFRQTDQYFFNEVQDNGNGIPRKLWDKIFDQNYTTKGDGKGGFGLYYSKKTLEKYGGSIEVLKSGKNKGTTFLVKLRRM